MASIVEKKGKKYNIWDKANNVWNKISFWTSSDDVTFSDGKSATTKHGAISGITSDLSGDSDNIAASIKCVKSLNDSLVSNIYVGSDGKLHKVQGGADSVLNFSGKPIETYVVSTMYGSSGMVLKDNGNTINSQGTTFNGSYLNVNYNNTWNFTALKDCKISYVSTQGYGVANNANINKIVNEQDLKVGDTITMPLAGIMVLNVYS